MVYPPYSKKELFSGRVKATGREDKGLYILPSWSSLTVNKHTAETSLAATQNKDMFTKRTPKNVDLKLWHKRLGHVSSSVLNKLFLIKRESYVSVVKDCSSVFPDTSSSALPHITEQWYAQDASAGSNQNSTAHDSSVLPYAASSSPSSTESSASSLPTAAPPSVDVSQVGSPALRRSARDKHPPLWMKNFVSLHANQHTPYGLTTYMCYDHLSPLYQAFIASSSSEVEPVSYAEAIKDHRWYKASGEIGRFNARLVAKGYNQREGIDYQETFSPVVKMVTVRTILSIAVVQHGHIHQMDIPASELCGSGEQQSQHDHSLFIEGSGDDLELILVYVDDIQAGNFNAPEKKSHLEAAVRVVKYVKNHPGQGVLLSSKADKRIRAYSNADWAAYPHSRKSITGILVKFSDSLISWKSNKQSTISRSSGESEYSSLASTNAELTWILALFKEVGIEVELSVEVHIDSKAAMQIAANPVFHQRTKHIEIDCTL
ncbi:PREDICTED: uncharacterized protein LOC109230071 [Nicotiana attenuata]|uniref:uncharacterized protein LOC109230071 n=1 Tax=Nicotiana attenuata TaxID=49451 RepID=UPI000904CEC4|nr:PREDICTED: uncharacterized protein LOC109230071 [Nicotiana attenuata]